MARGKGLRAGGLVGPAQPPQELKESMAQHIWNAVVAYQCANTIHHWAHQGGISGVKDIDGPFGDSRTIF